MNDTACPSLSDNRSCSVATGHSIPMASSSKRMDASDCGAYTLSTLYVKTASSLSTRKPWAKPRYSPAAGTGLSSHELNQPGCYRDVKDTTVVGQFKMKNPKPEMTEWGTPYFLAWTTTPWTLPSNTALCVGPKIDYVAVQTYNGYTGGVLLSSAIPTSFPRRLMPMWQTVTRPPSAAKRSRLWYSIQPSWGRGLRQFPQL